MTPADCPRRYEHTEKLTPLMEAFGYVLLRCECGMRYAAKIDREAN